MLDKTTIALTELAVHRVGNKIRNEGLTPADCLHPVSKQLESHLLNYFLTPFDSSEAFHFSHTANLSLNEIFTFSKRIFSDSTQLLSESINCVKHLYECSIHPKIKAGEVYVALLKNVGHEGAKHKALGIFKSETKDLFIKINERGRPALEINVEHGASLKSLDKGCIILDTQARDGYRVFIVDNNTDATRYWQNKFLNLAPVHNDHFLTEACLTLCRKFGDDILASNEKQKEEIFFLQKSIEFFANHDSFDLGEFTKHAFDNKSDATKFTDYKNQYEEKQGLPQLNDFVISKKSVQSAKRRFKNFIRLDTKIEVRLKFQDAENAEEFVERGYDNKRRMHFYKLFFNKEV